MTKISEMFTTPVTDAIDMSLNTDKPLFAFLSEETSISEQFVAKYLGTDNQDLNSQIEKHFICIKLTKDSHHYDDFKHLFKQVSAPSFILFHKNSVLAYITSDMSRAEFEYKFKAILSSREKLFYQRDQCCNAQNSTPTNIIDTTNYKQKCSKGFNQKGHNQKFDLETERIRNLIRLDEKERKSKLKDQRLAREFAERQQKQQQQQQQQQLEFQASAKSKAEEIFRPSKCTLCIKLFDGSSIVHDFESSQTLNDVRLWLDMETNHSIIRDTNANMPSFATSPTQDPSRYAFYQHSRKEFSDEDELETLYNLNLYPRSVVILKPIYDELPANEQNFASNIVYMFIELLKKLGIALMAFFDYGVDNYTGLDQISHQYQHQDQHQHDSYINNETLNQDKSSEGVKEPQSEGNSTSIQRQRNAVRDSLFNDAGNPVAFDGGPKEEHNEKIIEKTLVSSSSSSPSSKAVNEFNNNGSNNPSRCSTPGVGIELCASSEDLLFKKAKND